MNDNDWPYVAPEDMAVPVCRYCGHELTISSELIDATCTACFTIRRVNLALLAMVEASR